MNNNLLKIYLTELIPNISYLEILNPNLGFKKRKNIFGDKDIFDDFTEPIVQIVNDAFSADFILVPHNYFSIKNNEQYIRNVIDLSKKYSKKIILFAIGDSAENIDIPDCIILRMSQYARQKQRNEIIIPAYATDLSYGLFVSTRNKMTIPVIGFCGWASMSNLKNNIIFWIKNSLKISSPYRSGLYFRKKVISVLNKSSLIKTNFIIRDSYGANERTVKLDPKLTREEYRNNMIDSDFILAPKGDGNYSVRFYEALSLGRIPILIDTDCPLPLGKEIDYSRFILKVSYKDIDKMDKIVADFYSKLSSEQWLIMQKEAKRVFDEQLRIDVFFRYIFTKENLVKYSS